MGLVFGLVALGLTVIWGVMDIVNFAHGEFLMVGMYAGFLTATVFKVDPLFGLPVAAVVGYALGIVCYYGLVRLLLRGPMVAQLFGTFGLMLFLRNLALMIMGAEPRSVHQGILVGKSFVFGPGIVIELTKLAAGVSVLGGLCRHVVDVESDQSRKGPYSHCTGCPSRTLHGCSHGKDECFSLGFGRIYRLRCRRSACEFLAGGPQCRPSIHDDRIHHCGSRRFRIGPGGRFCRFDSRNTYQSRSDLGCVLYICGQRSAERLSNTSVQILFCVFGLFSHHGLQAAGTLRLEILNRAVDFSDFPKIDLYVAAAVGVFLLVFPALPHSGFTMATMIQFLMFSVYGMGWNTIGGYGGQVDLGKAQYVGIGAYTTAVMMIRWDVPFWVSLPIGMALAVGWSFVIGYPLFRLKGHYFAIATIATSLVLKDVFESWSFIGAARGLKIPIKGEMPNFLYPAVPTGLLLLLRNFGVFLYRTFLHQLVSTQPHWLSAPFHQGQRGHRAQLRYRRSLGQDQNICRSHRLCGRGGLIPCVLQFQYRA